MTQSNPLKTKILDPFPTQPNPTQPVGQPNPWTILVLLRTNGRVTKVRGSSEDTLTVESLLVRSERGLCPIRTADATNLDNFVARASAVWIGH